MPSLGNRTKVRSMLSSAVVRSLPRHFATGARLCGRHCGPSIIAASSSFAATPALPHHRLSASHSASFLYPASRSHGAAARALTGSPLSSFDGSVPTTSLPPGSIGARERGGSFLAAFCRDFSSSSSSKTVRILYGSQGGTAQLFAMQLGDELDELAEEDPASVPSDVTVSALNDPPGSAPHERLDAGDGATNVIITSVTGVGDPPDNCREFYEWIMSDDGGGGGGGGGGGDDVDWPRVKYAVFGCGNSVAHMKNYNVIGKRLDKRLEELGAKRVHALGLGDDSDCIEDDFDTWQDSLIQRLTGSAGEELKEVEAAADDDDAADQSLAVPKVESCYHIEDAEDEEEREDARKDAPSKYPQLILRQFADGRYDLPRYDVFHLDSTDTPFYKPGTKPLRVISNRALGTGSAEYVMREMRLSIEDHPDVFYEAGDHLMVYPRNAQCVVDSYLAALNGVNGADLIEGVEHSEKEGGKGKGKAYPHPVGVTVEETLLHCVDLSQPPSPAFARTILGRKDINYKEDIASTRTTPIELIRKAGKALSLEELLFNLPPLQPRYYSIASSPTVNSRQIYLTFRPVKYLSSLGHLHEGLCTSFMKQMHPVSMNGGFDDVGTIHPTLPAVVNSNPTFRLPSDYKTPLLLIAGGCGVAPIRSFLEERMHKYWEGKASPSGAPELGEAHVYLGFRSPRDEVYRSVVDASVRDGIVTGAHITYTKSCRKADKSCTLVTQAVEEESERVYDLVSNQGAHIYLCGGARQFGVAIEQVLLRIFMRHGDMESDEAEDCLRNLIKDGRLQEDLAD